MVHQAELENAKCSSDEEEDNESINNKNFPIKPKLEQGVAVN